MGETALNETESSLSCPCPMEHGQNESRVLYNSRWGSTPSIRKGSIKHPEENFALVSISFGLASRIRRNKSRAIGHGRMTMVWCISLCKQRNPSVEWAGVVLETCRVVEDRCRWYAFLLYSGFMALILDDILPKIHDLFYGEIPSWKGTGRSINMGIFIFERRLR